MRRPRPDVGMVFQQPHLFPWKTVRKNIALGPRMLGKSRSEARAIADGLIDMIGLNRFADAYPHSCPAACSSASRLHARWRTSRACC